MHPKLVAALEKIKSEPNKETFTYKGYKCLIKRLKDTGHLNGYVGLSAEHELHGVNYNNLNIECHGGLTFSDFWEEENDGLWYIGFDCGHAWDMQPLLYVNLKQIVHSYKLDGVEHTYESEPNYDIIDGTTYKDIEYVRNECKAIVDQLDGSLMK